MATLRFNSLLAIRMIALLPFIRFVKSSYARSKAGSCLIATQALSTNRPRSLGFFLEVIPVSIGLSPLECVEGMKPTKEQRLAKSLKRLMSSNSVNKVMAVTTPIPGMLINNEVSSLYAGVALNSLISRLIFSSWRRWCLTRSRYTRKLDLPLSWSNWISSNAEINR